MKCLTPQEISEWIRQTGQVEDPHHATEDMPSLLHVQFYSPSEYSRIESFVTTFLTEIVLDGDLLFQVVDWYPFEDCKQFTTAALWQAFGEMRQMGEVTGCLIPSQHWARAIALFSIMTGFRWQCYLYGSRDQTILYNREGDILDAWTSSSEKMDSIHSLIQRYKFSLV